MAKRLSARRIKAQRTYTYEEAGDALGVTMQTVRAWRRDGLAVMDGQKPHLILGAVLKAFIANRAKKSKAILAPHEFHCMSCRAPREAYGGMADYVAITPTRGVLSTLCGVCEGQCVKFASNAQLPAFAEKLTIAISNRE